jgi:hypothetical protein
MDENALILVINKTLFAFDSLHISKAVKVFPQRTSMKRHVIFFLCNISAPSFAIRV